MNREFNLLDEPWICVRKQDCRVTELSLKDAILRSHEYVSLAGENRTQDFVLLRLILAVIYTVFSRYDMDGNDVVCISEDYALDLWENIWQNGKFPSTPFERYFEKWHDRFWLFDEVHPFYQTIVVNGKSKKPINTSKMIGTLFESANKDRFFAERTKSNRKLSYAEAARWLIHSVNFDDIAAKDPTPKKTWVGQLGLIALRGNNLFETILLNYNPNIDGGNKSNPLWEREDLGDKRNKLVAIPNNQAELLTLQSRYMFLCRENGWVSSYYQSGGEYFGEKSVYNEQMTIWKRRKEKKNSPIQYEPEIHRTERQAWREFDSIAVMKEEAYVPGVILWLKELIEYNIISKDYMANVSMSTMVYDKKNSYSLPVIDYYDDELSFSSELLLNLGTSWRGYVSEEIAKCAGASKAVSDLNRNLQKAMGNSESKDHKISGESSIQEFYNRIDQTFRKWLASVKSDNNETEKLGEIENKICRIAIDYGNELAEQMSSSAILGRYVKGEIYSSAQALNQYQKKIYNIFKRAGEKQ